MLATGLFQGDGLFDAYVIALTIGGICLLVSASGWLAASLRSRIFSVLLGLGMLGYAGYLAFVFEGGTYRLFWYVFVLPFVAIGKMVSEHGANQLRKLDLERAAEREARKRERQEQLAQEQSPQTPPAVV